MSTYRLPRRPCLFLAFLASIALGAAVSLTRRPHQGVVPTRPLAQPPPIASHADPAGDAVRAMAEYQRACAARSQGQHDKAAAILTRLANSPALTEAQREFCRRELQNFRK